MSFLTGAHNSVLFFIQASAYCVSGKRHEQVDSVRLACLHEVDSPRIDLNQSAGFLELGLFGRESNDSRALYHLPQSN